MDKTSGPWTSAWPWVAPLFTVSLSSMHHNTDGWVLLVKKASSRSLAIHITRDTGTERRARDIPDYSIFEQKMFNLSSTTGQAKPTDQYFFKTWTAGPTKAFFVPLLFKNRRILWKTYLDGKWALQLSVANRKKDHIRWHKFQSERLR